MTAPVFTEMWLGPVGRLRRLPMIPVGSEWGLTHMVLGGTHESLGGQLTQDRIGVRREWSVDWSCLSGDDIAAVRAWQARLVRAPLRLIDPRERNRAGKRSAAGGSYDRRADGYAGGVGSYTVVQPTDLPAELAGLIDSAVSWTVPATGGRMHVDDAIVGDRIPMVPGEQITMSWWVKGTGTAQLTPGLFDINGGAVIFGGPVVTLTGGWQRLVYTFSAADRVTGSFAVSVNAAAAARAVLVTAAQWEAGPVATPWVPGFGCPRVAFGDLDHRLAGVGNRYGLGAVIREL